MGKKGTSDFFVFIRFEYAVCKGCKYSIGCLGYVYSTGRRVGFFLVGWGLLSCVGIMCLRAWNFCRGFYSFDSMQKISLYLHSDIAYHNAEWNAGQFSIQHKTKSSLKQNPRYNKSLIIKKLLFKKCWL